MMAAVIGVIGPVIATQIENLIHQIPFIQREAERLINFALDQRDRLPDQVTEKINDIVSYFSQMASDLLSNSLNIISSIVSTLFLLILVPFFLIYMLKDHERFIPAVANIFKVERLKGVFAWGYRINGAEAEEGLPISLLQI
ncbi:hypothetical protein DD924_01700 [Staphylococcus pseudintermedius]|uniref:AI-2E family transporter n=1 Tax=Staphylococcus pseudintermedius TaxID=283734 RepID=A0A317ZF39_STAPS|nr:hypothetical protein DD924_01700 [Staphylococcus pseudintermedius]